MISNENYIHNRQEKYSGEPNEIIESIETKHQSVFWIEPTNQMKK